MKNMVSLSLLMVSADGLYWWSLLMVSTDGLCWWSLLMVSADGLCWWSLLMVSTGGLCWWSLLMVSADGLCWWSLLMVSLLRVSLLRVSAGCLCWWSLLMVSADGLCLWSLCWGSLCWWSLLMVPLVLPTLGGMNQEWTVDRVWCTTVHVVAGYTCLSVSVTWSVWREHVSLWFTIWIGLIYLGSIVLYPLFDFTCSMSWYLSFLALC